VSAADARIAVVNKQCVCWWKIDSLGGLAMFFYLVEAASFNYGMLINIHSILFLSCQYSLVYCN